MKKSVVFVFALILGITQAGVAARITPKSAIAGTWQDSDNPVRDKERAPTRMIDGSGLIFVGAPGEEEDYTKYQYLPSPSQHGINTSWTGLKTTSGTINDLWAIIDLGQIYDIATITLFNFNPATDGPSTRATQNLDLWVREDDGFSNANLDGVAFNSTGWTLLTVAADMTLTRNYGGTTQTVADVLTSLNVKGRYVALDINSNYGDSKFSLVGEVQVFGDLHVPESDLINPVNAYSNFEIDFKRPALNLINRSGLLFTGAMGEEGDYKKYEYNYSDNFYEEYSGWTGKKSAGTAINDIWVVVDLGSVCQLNALSIFNFNSSTNTTVSRSAKEIDVWVRDDLDVNNTLTNGVAFNTNGWRLVTVDYDMTLQRNPGITTQRVHNVIGLNGVSGRMIALDINSNYGDASMCSLGEVQIFGKLNITNVVRVIPAEAMAYSEIIFEAGPTLRGVTNTINGSGLDFTGAPGEEGEYAKYQYLPGTSAHGEYRDWMGKTKTGDGVNKLWLIYDLGSVRELRALSVFNFNPLNGEVITRAVKSLSLWVRSDAGFSNTHLDQSQFDRSGWTALAHTMHLNQNPGGTTQTIHDVLGFADVSARYIALDINENYGYGDIAALGEVLFFCEPLPPIPLGTMILVK